MSDRAIRYLSQTRHPIPDYWHIGIAKLQDNAEMLSEKDTENYIATSFITLHYQRLSL